MNDDLNQNTQRAFPRPATDGPEYPDQGQRGMTLRDYFAAHSGFTWNDAVTGFEGTYKRHGTIEEVTDYLGRIRLRIANAMLKARQSEGCGDESDEDRLVGLPVWVVLEMQEGSKAHTNGMGLSKR